MTKRTFLGRGWNFPPEFEDKSYPTKMAEGDEDIRQSLTVLLGTSPGERVHRYDYGCGLRKYVFEQMDTTTQTLMKEEIERAILLFEPRISLDGIHFDVRQTEGMLLIRLEYTVRATNRRSNMVYPFYLNEGTDITQ